MGGRLYIMLVAAFWIAAMTWLVITKVLPTWHVGDKPRQVVEIPAVGERGVPFGWNIKWHNETIGYSVSQARRLPDGTGEVRSVVTFDRLSVPQIFSEMFGSLAPLVRPLISGGQRLELHLSVRTKLRFDADSRLQAFETGVQLDRFANFLRLFGNLEKGQMQIVAESDAELGTDGEAIARELYRGSFDLTGHDLTIDTLSPQKFLKNLKLGQTWTMPVFRPFPPGSPPGLLRATAEKEETITIDGVRQKGLLVTYLPDAGSGIGISRKPVARMWVDAQGEVLQHEVAISSLTLRFERMSSSQATTLAAELQDGVWSRRSERSETVRPPTVRPEEVRPEAATTP